MYNSKGERGFLSHVLEDIYLSEMLGPRTSDLHPLLNIFSFEIYNCYSIFFHVLWYLQKQTDKHKNSFLINVR